QKNQERARGRRRRGVRSLANRANSIGVGADNWPEKASVRQSLAILSSPRRKQVDAETQTAIKPLPFQPQARLVGDGGDFRARILVGIFRMNRFTRGERDT